MRNTILILLLTAIASVAAFGQEHGARETAVAAPKDPTVSEILANYVRAIGGAEKFAKVESRLCAAGSKCLR